MPTGIGASRSGEVECARRLLRTARGGASSLPQLPGSSVVVAATQGSPGEPCVAGIFAAFHAYRSALPRLRLHEAEDALTVVRLCEEVDLAFLVLAEGVH